MLESKPRQVSARAAITNIFSSKGHHRSLNHVKILAIFFFFCKLINARFIWKNLELHLFICYLFAWGGVGIACLCLFTRHQNMYLLPSEAEKGIRYQTGILVTIIVELMYEC